MLKTFFNSYKLYIYAALFIGYSVGLWNVASTYTEAKYVQKQLDVAVAVLETKEKNEVTAQAIQKTMEETLAALRPQNTVINRTIQNEILKDTVYLDCKSNPNVMREYQRKLDLQPK